MALFQIFSKREIFDVYYLEAESEEKAQDLVKEGNTFMGQTLENRVEIIHCINLGDETNSRSSFRKRYEELVKAGASSQFARATAMRELKNYNIKN